ncbi:MAG: MarR family transcriptional regulator [Lachnospiraceae bacterium]
MNPELEFARKTALAYNVICKPLCQELNLPQTAFDILMFLGNNPSYRTASDIVEIRHIKANLVSVNVDRLVKEGYLSRQAVRGTGEKRNSSVRNWPGPSSGGGRNCSALF